MQTQIMRYARDKKRRKVGVFLAQPSPFDPQRILIGWSLCHKGDDFDRGEGISMAVVNLGNPMPPSLIQQAKQFRVQCFLHFEGKNIQSIGEMPVHRVPKVRLPVTPARHKGHLQGCLAHQLRSHFNRQAACTCSTAYKGQEVCSPVSAQEVCSPVSTEDHSVS